MISIFSVYSTVVCSFLTSRKFYLATDHRFILDRFSKFKSLTVILIIIFFIFQSSLTFCNSGSPAPDSEALQPPIFSLPFQCVITCRRSGRVSNGISRSLLEEYNMLTPSQDGFVGHHSYTVQYQHRSPHEVGSSSHG